jgi:alpha-1,2-mannosyltransferase
LISFELQASQSLLFGNFTFSIVVTFALISVSRILALWHYYHAPLTLAFDFQHTELPRLLNATGLLPIYPENTPEEDIPPVDLSLVKEFNLKLCLGKEWHRFPGNYLIPSGIQVEFVKSEFDGMLPRHFETEKTGEGNDVFVGLAKDWWLKPQTSYVPNDLNDLNKEDPSHYVRCAFLPGVNFGTNDKQLNLSRFPLKNATISLTLISLYTLFLQPWNRATRPWTTRGRE